MNSKVLIIADFIGEGGGTLTYFKQLVMFLDKKKVLQLHLLLKKKQLTPEVVSFIRKRNMPYSIYQLPNINFTKTIGLRFNYYLEQLVNFSFWFLQYIKYRPELILHSTGGCFHYSLFLFPVKVLAIQHSLQLSSLDTINKFILRKFLGKKKRILTVSAYSLNCIIKNFEIPLSKQKYCDYIYNYHPKRIEIQKEKKNNEVIVLTIGHVVKYKNPEFWLILAKRITDKYENVKFIWAGGGEDLEIFQNETLNLPRINFVGHIKDVDKLYQKCDIYLQPSTLESHGISVLGAMAYGIPCVVSDVGGLPESVLNNKTGFVFPTNDLENAEKKFILLIKNQSLRKELGRNGFHRFERKFSQKSWSKKMDIFLKTNFIHKI